MLECPFFLDNFIISTSLITKSTQPHHYSLSSSASNGNGYIMSSPATSDKFDLSSSWQCPHCKHQYPVKAEAAKISEDDSDGGSSRSGSSKHVVETQQLLSESNAIADSNAHGIDEQQDGEAPRKKTRIVDDDDE